MEVISDKQKKKKKLNQKMEVISDKQKKNLNQKMEVISDKQKKKQKKFFVTRRYLEFPS